MTDIVVIEVRTKNEVRTKKGRPSSKGKKAKNAPTHPKVSEMVNSAISSLKERGGSSLQAIKKYISSQYKVDTEKLSPFIKKYLKTAVLNGNLVQTKGKGASGSFKMSGSAKEKPVKKPKKKAIPAAKPKKANVSSPKKSAVVKKATEKKKTKKATPAKKPKPAAKAVKKARSVKTATKQKKPKSSPKKTTGKKGKK